MPDVKVEDLTEITNPALTDLLYVAADPGGTPASRKATLANVALAMGSGSLTDWTPTVTQSGAVTCTVTYAKYCVFGPLVYICARLDITGAGSAGNDIIIGGLPSTPAIDRTFGQGRITDAGTAFYAGDVHVNPADDTLTFRAHLETNDIGSDPSFALANTDHIEFFALYPAA